MKMKAAVVRGINDIRYEDIEKPVPKKGEVLIRVKATGICGSDVPRVLNGAVHSFPIVLGHEFSGVIEELGEGVTGLTKGKRATAVPLVPCFHCEDCQKGNFSLCKHYSFIGSRVNGAFAEYVCVSARNVVEFDDSVSFELGAMFEPSTVALHGIYLNDFHGGEDVAVFGYGTIGYFTAQWAKILGAKTVTVFDISEERLHLAKEAGADFCINTLDDGFEEEALRLTGGRGFGYVFETAGNEITMKLSFALAANKARVCFIGTPTKEVTFTRQQMEMINRKEFLLTGSWMSYSAPFPGKEWTMTAEYFGKGILKFHDALIYKQYPLKDIAKAFAEFETPGKVKGKILIRSGN
mgnify:CR=1 FL=1